jgi:tRNA/tmRNA/rRNA uracil-C5-methylase (TrmA/RlmC/RlmD family)
MIVTLHVDDIAYGGKGVARLENGKVCFVPAVLPGETVNASIVEEHAGFTKARLIDIVTPSPFRIPPACPLAPAPSSLSAPCSLLSCPGCTYQHARYDEELRLKQHQFETLLVRQAGCAADVLQPPVPAPASLGYRNKMALHAQRDGKDVRLGYFAEDNTTVVDVPACPLALPALNERLAELRANPSFLAGLRDGATLTFRHTARDLAVWWRGEAKANDTWLVESTSLGPLAVPRGSFFQVNPAVAGLLLSHVMATLTAHPPRQVVDLFCGVGLFALAAAKLGVPSVIGADVDGPAMQAADYNARQLGLTGIRWSAGTARKILAAAGSGLAGTSTLLIVDPPRAGLGRNLVGAILGNPPERLLYVSCAPDTLARDLVGLREGGYRVERAQLFDMFPRTAHFESVTALRRG